MSTEQQRKGAAFAALHHAGEPFVIPNPWDAGTARVLASFGFAALATTSAGLAHARGVPDGANQVRLEDALANAAEIVAATGLPVTADLESGFDDPAETIRAAAAVGLVGGSIEDAAGHGRPIRELGEAVERVRAAVEAARGLPFAFTLTARAENFLYGNTDLDDTIARLRAYADAGADVVYAPGLPDAEAIRRVCASVDRPVNVLAAGAAAQLTVGELGRIGARRISLGSALSRAAFGAVAAAAQEIQRGTFGFVADAMPYAELNRLMEGGPTPSAG